MACANSVIQRDTLVGFECRRLTSSASARAYLELVALAVMGAECDNFATGGLTGVRHCAVSSGLSIIALVSTLGVFLVLLVTQGGTSVSGVCCTLMLCLTTLGSGIGSLKVTCLFGTSCGFTLCRISLKRCNPSISTASLVLFRHLSADVRSLTAFTNWS